MKNEARIKKLLKELHREICKYYEEELGQQREPEAESCELAQYGSATFAWVPAYTSASTGTVEAYAVAMLTVHDKTGGFVSVEAEVE